jgi:hypothetical protein
MDKMYCILCGEELASFPLYNNGEDEKYAPSMLFCGNSKCARFALLTTVFSSKKLKEKDEGKKAKKN